MNKFLEALSALRAFILYRPTDKVPVDTDGRNSDAQNSTTWMLGHEAQAWGAALGYGVGIVLHEGCGLACIDIDGALQTDGTWSPLAVELCQRFAGAYIEVSMSGRGLHIIFSYVGSLPPHLTKNSLLHVECYSRARYIALTGTNAVGSPIFEATDKLYATLGEYFAGTPVDKSADWVTNEPDDYDRALLDDEVLLAKAMKSKSMATIKGTRATFEDLWNAHAEVLGRIFPPNPTSAYPYDASSVDQALFNHLAFWCGGNCERMERIAQRAPLRREKWERTDYLRATITRARSWTADYPRARGRNSPVPAPTLAHVLYAPPAPQTAPPPPALVAPPPPAADGTAAPTAPPPWDGAGMPPIPTSMPVVEPATEKGNVIGTAGQHKLFNGHVYVQDMHQIMTPAGFTLDQKRFDVVFGGRIFMVTPDGTKPTESAWECFTKSQTADFPKVRGMYFEPRATPGAIMEREGQLWINSWSPIEIRSVPGDVTPFLTHLQKLFPKDWRILLNYLKFMVQRKGEKAMWWPFLQGVPGNGKSFISETMEYCIGLKYTQKPTPKNLDSQFNASLYGCLFLAFEDVKVRDDFGAMWETLKPMVTNARLEIQPKGVDKVTREVCFNAIMNSNHKNGIRKEPDDRRIASFFAAQQRRSHLQRDGLTKDYFTALWLWAKADGWAHVAHYLANDPIDADAQFIEAPITSCTAEHISLSLGGAEQETLEAVRANTPGFCGGWINSIKFDQVLTIAGRARAVPRAQRGDLLESLGYIPHPGLPEGRVTTPLTDSSRPVLYVTLDHTTLVMTDPGAIKAAYEAAQKPK